MTTLIPKVDLMNGGSTPIGAINRPINLKLQDIIHVKDFGAIGDGATDDTTAIQNAINYAIAQHCELEITNGNYLVSSVTVESANGLIIHGAGSLIGKSTGTYAAVLIIHNSVDVTITGRLGVSGSYNTGYGAGIKVYQTGAGATSFLMFENIVIANAQIGWLFGDITQPDVVLSEITVKGGYTYGCPISVKAIGAETVVNFIGTILMASASGGTGAWLSLPRYIIYTIGSYVNVTSGEMLLVDSSVWAGVKVEPIASTLGNIYGSVYVQGAGFECASQYVVIENPNALAPIAAASAETAVRFIGCSGYHSGNFASMVQVATDFSGSIVFSNNNFYAGSVRTLGNINAVGNTLCNIYCDAQSFGYNFIQGLVAIQGGIVHFDKRVIWNVEDCNGEALPLNTPTTLIWTATTNTQDTQRFIPNYSYSTGIFTVPAGGLKSVTITATLRTSQSNQPLSLNVLGNGSVIAYGSAGLSGFVRQTFDLGDLAAGTTLAVQATQGGIASVTNGGQYEDMIISARN
jgi:hypothetical protein